MSPGICEVRLRPVVPKAVYKAIVQCIHRKEENL